VTVIGRFVLYNLLASLAAGLLAWLVALAVMRLLAVRSFTLRLCFMALPLLKSILVLLGIGLIFPWPTHFFINLHAQAVPLTDVLPFLLAWALAALLIERLAAWRERKKVLRGARPAQELSPRPQAAFERVLDAFKRVPPCGEGAPCDPASDSCCIMDKLPDEVRLLVSDSIDSPLAITDRRSPPAILLPAGLLPRLTDAELEYVLAHELTHFSFRPPGWRSASSVRRLALVFPVAGLGARYLQREEEKACDDMVVSILGQPEAYAQLLLKCYRFALEQRQSSSSEKLATLPQLLGWKPLLSERVEHLLHEPPRPCAWLQRPLVIWTAWVATFYLLYFASS